MRTEAKTQTLGHNVHIVSMLKHKNAQAHLVRTCISVQDKAMWEGFAMDVFSLLHVQDEVFKKQLPLLDMCKVTSQG